VRETEDAITNILLRLRVDGRPSRGQENDNSVPPPSTRLFLQTVEHLARA